VLVCSAHHWRYDICSGRGINPASARLAPVRVEATVIHHAPDGMGVKFEIA